MGEGFAGRFAEVRSKLGPLVFGLDPSGPLLEGWELGDSPEGLDRFADIVIDAAVGNVGLIKPQSAFYERHGWRGVRTLQRLIADARQAGILVILDAKRGDVRATNAAYAEAFLGSGAPLEADALTVHPYLGLGAMDPFIRRAEEGGSCVLVVTRSSNPEGRAVQSAVVESGQSVEASLVRQIGALNRSLAPGDLGPVGAVIGPTHIEPSLDLQAMQGLFLAPGVGAQGATSADVARVSPPARTASCPVCPGGCWCTVPTGAGSASRLRPWPPNSERYSARRARGGSA